MDRTCLPEKFVRELASVGWGCVWGAAGRRDLVTFR